MDDKELIERLVNKIHKWSDEELIAKILEKTDEKDFFEDMLKWIRHTMAPTKRRQIIEDIRDWGRTRRLSHSDFCMHIFSSRIRASKPLENRMLLGDSNEWSKKYFENFPINKNEQY